MVYKRLLRQWQALGSEAGAECKIDSIAQSFAVLSGFGSQDKIKQALDSAATHLFDRNNGIVKLFTPPFDGKGPNRGILLVIFREQEKTEASIPMPPYGLPRPA